MKFKGKFLLSFITTAVVTSTLSHATDINGSMMFGGKNRTYLLHVPASYNSSQPSALVLAFHGLTLNGSKMADITGFSPIADQENFIVVYPDGLNKKWNSPGGPTDDVGFISALIDQLSTNYNIDPSRIFAAGASNGGMFTYRLGIELTQRFAAIAVVAGYMPNYPAGSTPSPAKALPVVHFHGTADFTIPYINAEEAVDYWSGIDNCSSTPVSTTLPDIDPNDGTTVVEYTYPNGINNSCVELYKINDGGHTWPGTTSGGMPGKVSKDIDASEIIWDFFKSQSTASNVAPVVSLISPLVGTSFTAPASITIKASALDADGTIAQVEFFNGSESLKTDMTKPYNYIWKNVTPGNYTIRAVATDNKGATTETSVTVTVNPQKLSTDIAPGNLYKTLYDQSTNQLVITQPLEPGEYDLFVFDALGKEIVSLQGIQDEKKVISMHSSGQGVYVFYIKPKNTSPASGKFMVTR